MDLFFLMACSSSLFGSITTPARFWFSSKAKATVGQRGNMVCQHLAFPEPRRLVPSTPLRCVIPPDLPPTGTRHRWRCLRDGRAKAVGTNRLEGRVVRGAAGRRQSLAELHLQAPDRFKTRLGNAMSSVRSIPLPKLSRPSGTSGSRRRPGAALAAARRLLVDSLAAGEWRSHDWLAREARSLSEK